MFFYVIIECCEVKLLNVWILFGNKIKIFIIIVSDWFIMIIVFIILCNNDVVNKRILLWVEFCIDKWNVMIVLNMKVY